MLRRTAEFGVTIGVQNHHDIACSSEALFELIRAVGEPNCKAMFDAWAPALHGDDLIQSARKMGAVTVHTTIANYVRLRRFHYDPAIVNFDAKVPSLLAVPIEEGFIDYRAFLQALWPEGSREALPTRSARRFGTAEASKRWIAMHVHFLIFSMESGRKLRWNPAIRIAPTRRTANVAGSRWQDLACGLPHGWEAGNQGD